MQKISIPAFIFEITIELITYNFKENANAIFSNYVICYFYDSPYQRISEIPEGEDGNS